jgi:hypothetical protein
LISKNILVNPVHVRSVVSLNGDDLGVQDKEGNVILVDEHIDEATGQVSKESSCYVIPSDAFRDQQYLDWLLTDKTGEETLVNDYNDLVHEQFQLFSKGG